MNKPELEKALKLVSDFITDYYANIESYPVKSLVKPKEIFNNLPALAPENSESYEKIIDDFKEIILPGITHWQSPNFFAYFPANSSVPSLAAELLTSALAVQGMKWETSPAAAELEEKVLIWLRDAMGIPSDFYGVIQDTASTSTLASILTAREYFSDNKINISGFNDQKFRVYCSEETHSSIEKAVKISGIGKNNLIKISTNSDFSIDTNELEQKIIEDIKNGYKPLYVVAALGTTGSTAIDNLEEIAKLKKKYNFWLHVDAAYLGTALLLPEYKWIIKGIEEVDTFVFNPHKWMFTNFDCSVYFLKDKNALLNTFEIIPEYLRTDSDNLVNNYCDWGIPLGRRFRALKLWFVIRHFGIKGLQEKIRYHLILAKDLFEEIQTEKSFEILAPLTANVICFRYRPDGINEEKLLNEINEKLLKKINETGKVYLSHTKLNSKFTIRIVIAQTNVTDEHTKKLWKLIKEISKTLI